MFLGMLMLFLLTSGLALIFGANFIKGRDKTRAFMMLGGVVMSLIPLGILVASFFYPIFD